MQWPQVNPLHHPWSHTLKIGQNFVQKLCRILRILGPQTEKKAGVSAEQAAKVENTEDTEATHATEHRPSRKKLYTLCVQPLT